MLSKLHLVDLAGSERTKKSGVLGAGASAGGICCIDSQYTRWGGFFDFGYSEMLKSPSI